MAVKLAFCDGGQCPNCNSSMIDKPIPDDIKHMYGGDNFLRVIGIEYSYDHPQYYDGISEWRCPDCGYREGRWSGLELAEGETELKWGGSDD